MQLPLLPLVYHPVYNITAFGLERMHPFDSRKYQRIHDALIARGLRRRGDFIRPRPASRETLLRVHTADYLDSLKIRETLVKILEVPAVRQLPEWMINWRILRPMRSATGGTILATRLAMEHGLAINLGGGFHHAAAGWGGGFCVYSDAALAAKTLHDEGLARKVLVVDLDAHQGNGTASVFREWPWAKIFDLYEDNLFPFRKEEEDYPLPVASGLSGSDYLTIVQKELPQALNIEKPDLVIYNAGSDPYVGDPLAHYRLTESDLAERDMMVASLVRERSIPMAMILSGGYSSISWKIHADSIEDLLTRFDRS